MRLREAIGHTRQWTPFVFAWPRRYVDRGSRWRSFDFEAWTDQYEWRQDTWNGWMDVARPPVETVTEATGDCEDFALVAASWALAQGRTPVGLAFCFPSRIPVPRHVVAYDRDRVYSSGDVTEERLESYLERSEYRWLIRRRLA